MTPKTPSTHTDIFLLVTERNESQKKKEKKTSLKRRNKTHGSTHFQLRELKPSVKMSCPTYTFCHAVLHNTTRCQFCFHGNSSSDQKILEILYTSSAGRSGTFIFARVKKAIFSLRGVTAGNEYRQSNKTVPDTTVLGC